jgi:DNA-binding transcriptional LysR family regulator
MDTQHLKTFVEVVQQGSFAGAARALDMDPSAVTRAVSALEAVLGTRLLQRTTRKIALTEAGAGYLERVKPLLEELERAGEELQSASGQVRGTVRVTASVAYGQTVLVPLLPQLHAQHPELQIDLVLSDAVVDLVSERIDVALRLGPAVDSSLVGLRLAPVRPRVVASPAYLKRHGRPRLPQDLAQCDCLRFSLPVYRTQWSFRAPGGPVETVAVRGWLVMSTALALHRAALDGLGPALLADWLVGPDLAAGRLVDLFPALDVTATNFDSAVWLLYASREHVPRRVRALVDFIKAQYEKAPPRVPARKKR